jgi:hydrogenase assembly chaperone HypC/HupF
MCLLVPGKIIKIENNEATVDYDVEQRQGVILEDTDETFKEGDYVLIQGGFIVQKVDSREAKRALELYKKAIEES